MKWWIITLRDCMEWVNCWPEETYCRLNMRGNFSKPILGVVLSTAMDPQSAQRSVVASGRTIWRREQILSRLAGPSTKPRYTFWTSSKSWWEQEQQESSISAEKD